MASTYPSSSSSRQTKRLTKDQRSCVVLIVGICCFLGALLLYTGSQDAYKVSTLSRGLCRVRSVNVKYTRYNYFPCWNVTVMYENRIREEYMIESTGTRSDRWAWIKARKYQVIFDESSFKLMKFNLAGQWNISMLSLTKWIIHYSVGLGMDSTDKIKS